MPCTRRSLDASALYEGGLPPAVTEVAAHAVGLDGATCAKVGRT